ncbi:MAG: O-antigen ligase family protein [Geothrix sp.]|nr:O-antigen ligase family protein [Geothrix sp.]
MAPHQSEVARTPIKGILLAVLMVIILSGALPIFSYFFRSLTWLIWIAIFGIIYRFSKELPLLRLISPAGPYLIWLFFYLIWALIVSPNTNLAYAFKVALTTTTLGLCMAILTAKPVYLRTFASAVQFAVIGNVITLVLILWSAKFAALVQTVAPRADTFQVGITRFGGLWGNPNMAGYICLVATILSVLAIPWIAWLGRLSCLPLLYLAESRKSLILYVLILLLYLVVVQRRNIKFWLVALSAVFFLSMAFVLNDGLRAKAHSVSKNPAVSRLTDLSEEATTQSGGETRLALLQQWTTVLSAAPWYGYGLQAMAGAIHDEKNPEKVVSKGLFPLGTHNTYLGLLVEVGPVGFIGFILVMLYYARLCLVTPVDPIARWVLMSFLLCNGIILFVSQDHLFCFEGKIAFTLFFLLPSSPGLRQMGRWRTESP